MGGLKETEIRKPTFVDTLRLEWMSPNYYGRDVVLVEGDDDKDFYSNLFLDSCYVKKTSGCAKLIEYHQQMDAAWTYSCHIAIKDADFDRANGTMISLTGFFYTDCHDHEMMAASSDDFITDLLSACNSPHSVANVRSQIFADLHVLSMFRWYNHTMHTHLNCKKGVELVGAKTADLHNPSWLYAQYMNRKVNKDPNKGITTSLTDFATFCSTHTTNDFDLTNGHNFIARFCGIIEGDQGSYPFPLINSIVQTYYQPKYFRSTQLYADIAGWEASHVKILK